MPDLTVLLPAGRHDGYHRILNVVENGADRTSSPVALVGEVLDLLRDNDKTLALFAGPGCLDGRILHGKQIVCLARPSTEPATPAMARLVRSV